MQTLYLIFFFLLGTIFGSFYNVVGLRIPKDESILRPRSHCEKCKHLLAWYEMIPILSFLSQKGKCRYCGYRLSYLYLFSEIFCGLLFALSYYSFGFSSNMLIALILSSVMIMVTVSDLSYMIIPNRFIVIPTILILLIKFISEGLSSFTSSILSGLIAFLIMYVIMLFGSFLLKKEALGGADVKLMFLVGVCVEPFLALLVIIIGSFIALPVSLYLLIRKKENAIPFGPFLVLGLLIVFFTKLNAYEIINLFLSL